MNPVSITNNYRLKKAGEYITILHSWDCELPPGVYKLEKDCKEDCGVDLSCRACLVRNYKLDHIGGFCLIVRGTSGALCLLCNCVVAGISSAKSLVECMYAGKAEGISLDEFMYDSKNIIIGRK